MIKEYQLRKLQNSYEVTLNYKGVKVRVAFTGGNVYNSIMPKFRTDNPFKMKALEESQLFKNKEVVLLRTIGAPAPAPQLKRKAPVQHVRPIVVPLKKDLPKKEEETIVKEEEGADVPASDTTEMNFGSLDEAILFVAEHYNQQLTAEKDVREILKANGINPHINRK